MEQLMLAVVAVLVTNVHVHPVVVDQAAVEPQQAMAIQVLPLLELVVAVVAVIWVIAQLLIMRLVTVVAVL
jgi:hypothetical protein